MYFCKYECAADMGADEIEFNSGSGPSLFTLSFCRSQYDLPIAMDRPVRTRRLSIAAMVSLLAAVIVAGAGVRSFWIDDLFSLNHGREVDLNYGCFQYSRIYMPSISEKDERDGPVRRDASN
jgi:hypothetical protein